MSSADFEFPDLARLALPRSIALIGASDKPDSIGRRTLENLTTYSEWDGELLLVNPRGDEIGGRRVHAAIEDLPGAPDVAILAVRADQVVDSLQRCGERGTRFAIVFTSGFGEAGGDGYEVEARMREIARSTGMRIYGPNCPGLTNMNAKLGMSFSPAWRIDAMPGPVGVASQGGGMGRAFLQSGMERGLGTGIWFSAGNEADLEVSDYIHYMADAPDIRVIATVLEGVRNGPRFMAAALHAARRGKPIVALKIGKSDYGIKAAQSHTAAIAGSAEVNSAVFRELGIVEVDDTDELVDAASLLARGQSTGRERVAVYCFSGGTVAHTSDRVGAAGLELSTFAPATREALRADLPPYAAIDNPVDITAEVLVNSELTYTTLKTTAQDPNTDLVIVPVPVEYGRTSTLLAQNMVRVQAETSTPVVSVWMSDRTGEGHAKLIAGGLTPMRSVRNAVLAMRRYRDFGRWRAEFQEGWKPLGSAGAAPAATRSIPEAAAKAVLKKAGIAVPEGQVVHGAEEAAQAFDALVGGRVALKVVSSRITHKTDVGGVKLGIASAADASAAFGAIVDRVARSEGRDAIEGVLVEAMLPAPFVEAVVGIHRDPVFGHVCSFGLGGVSIELFKDVSRRLLPLTPASARAMVEETRCHQLLAGHRGQGAYDIDALVQVLLALSGFVAAHADTIEELEINPLAVRPQGQGVAALDAVLTIKQTENPPW